MRTQNAILFLIFTFSWFSHLTTAEAKITNDPKSEYKLAKNLGPWMIMVGSFSDVQDPERKKDGLSAESAARKLVHELREKGIPAYVYGQEAEKKSIETYNRMGNKQTRTYKAQNDMVCVLAGNYPAIDHPVAQQTLTMIKKFRPAFFADPKSGAIVRQGTDGKTGPFVGAFLTINPLLDPNDVAEHKVDNVVKALNSGIDFPLVSLKHKYSLKIATFTGKSAIPLGNSRFAGHESTFDTAIKESGPYSLARAGEDATQLAYALRQNPAVTKTLGRNKFESYVYHDKFQSYVTVGGFDSPDDPELRAIALLFRANYEMEDGEYKQKCKVLSLPNRDPSAPPIQTWAFDPIPELVEVPRIR